MFGARTHGVERPNFYFFTASIDDDETGTRTLARDAMSISLPGTPAMANVAGGFHVSVASGPPTNP